MSTPLRADEDPGLQPQRTAFAWNRTSLALLGNVALLLHRDVLDSAFAVPAALGLLIAVAVLTIGQHRRVALRRRPLPRPLALAWQIRALGWSVVLMAGLTGVLLALPWLA